MLKLVIQVQDRQTIEKLAGNYSLVIVWAIELN